MREIHIHYVDFWKNFDREDFIITKLLRKNYEVCFDEKSPQYVICSHFGTDYLKYNCIRILYLGEAKAPDFNVYDYAIAFDDIHFGDRYIRYPHYLLDEEKVNLAINKHKYRDEYYLSKKKFCNCVVSNGSGAEERDSFLTALSEYKLVDSGGKYRNNLPDGKPVSDKLEFQRQYRYSFAFENSAFPGYITEKITDAWAAVTIPIYWGAPDIIKDFNREAFINCNKMKNPEDLVKRIKEIENNPEEYLRIMKAPIINGGRIESLLENNGLEEFLNSIIEQEYSHAFRRNSKYTMWGRAYEHHLFRWSSMEQKWWFRKLRNIARKTKGYQNES